LYGLQLIGLVFLGLSVLSVLVYPKIQRNTKSNEQVSIFNLKKQIIKPLRYILDSKILFILLIIGIFSGSIKGSLDEYVPILLLEKGILISLIGYALFGLEVVKSFGGFITQWIPQKQSLQKIILLCMGVGFIMISISSLWITLVIFALILLMDSVLWIQNDISIQHQSNDSNRATISSVKNFFTEFISACIFLLAWIFGGSLLVTSYFLIGGLILVVVGIVALLFKAKKI
jgi:hypothetical protein